MPVSLRWAVVKGPQGSEISIVHNLYAMLNLSRLI